MDVSHTDPFDFRWEVPTNGFQWITTTAVDEEGGEKPFLWPGHPLGGSREVKRYFPLQRPNSGLFKDFANTEPTKDEIREFANQYGQLGGEITAMVQLPASAIDGEKDALGEGESFGAWFREIELMKLAIDLWEAIKNEDRQFLSDHFVWDQNGVRFQHELERAWIGSEDMGEARLKVLEHTNEGDLFLPARRQLQRMVNKNIEGRVSPQLLWDEEWTDLELHFVPNSLIGALWLQFAQAIGGDKNFRSCKQCGKWFELHPDVARTNKRYCSNACRSKHYRQRKKKARELSRQGVGLEQIAETVNSDTETVSGWIKNE